MPTSTTHYGLQKPLVNNATDQDLWGGELNNDMDDIDSLMLSALNFITSVKTASFSITAPTTGTTSTGSSSILFLCDATLGAIVGSLPACSTVPNGFKVAFKKMDSGSNHVTPTVAGSDTIDGASTLSITSQYQWAILIADGVSTWNAFNTSSSGLAPLNSPAFTGIPTAPTATARTGTTQLATTAYADSAARFGAWTVNGYSAGVVYGPTTTDGFVCAYVTASGSTAAQMNGITDSSATPGTSVIVSGMTLVGGTLGIMMPVRKGDYWEIVLTNIANTPAISWLPMGN